MNRYIVFVYGSEPKLVRGLRNLKSYLRGVGVHTDMHYYTRYRECYASGSGTAGYGSIPCPSPIQEEWDTEIPF